MLVGSLTVQIPPGVEPVSRCRQNLDARGVTQVFKQIDTAASVHRIAQGIRRFRQYPVRRDESAFDRSSEYFDPDSRRETPMWFMVDLKAVSTFRHPVTLPEIKAQPALSEMALVRVSRLSVVPVTPDEWDIVCAMGKG